MMSDGDGNHKPPLTQFCLAGIVCTVSYQKCKCHLERLHRVFPDRISKPFLRPMLNVDWQQFLTKIQRKFGGKSWYTTKCCLVIIDGTLLGDDDDLMDYLQDKFFFSMNMNFEIAAQCALTGYIRKLTENGRQMVYMRVSIGERSVGALLFLLYNDIVPQTCANFIDQCSLLRHRMNQKSIFRVAKPSFIQSDGFPNHHKHLPCENYAVPHDRRGVLSMCNRGKHRDNHSQFNVSLAATPWMDYKYVAFGQLIHGEEVLQAIEKVPTEYDHVQKPIRITACGEYHLGLSSEVDEGNRMDVRDFFAQSDHGGVKDWNYQKDVLHPQDMPSNTMLRANYQAGLYGMIMWPGVVSSSGSSHSLIGGRSGAYDSFNNSTSNDRCQQAEA